MPDEQTKRRSRAEWAVVFIGVALVLPSLWAGLHWDDIPMAQNLGRWLAGTSDQAWWDLFNLDAPDPRRRFGGRVPWWSADGLSVRFFRPVASATHLLDHWVWPSSPVAMHAHSVAWFALLLFSVVRFFRLLLPERVARVAGVVYAVSYVHAVPVGWLSNRNALIAGVFGFLACAAYVRSRRGDGRWLWAPGLLLLSLVSAESGVSVLAFVVGYELTQGREEPAGRWLKLAGMLIVVVLWRLAYSGAGFGAVGSGGYIDPVRSPGIFVREAPQRFATLVVFLLSPARALVAYGLPEAARYALGAVFAAGGLVVAWAARQRSARLWLASAILCLLPLLAASPGERLLTFAMAAASPVVATALLDAWESSGWRRAAGLPIVLSFGVVSPLVLLAGSFDQSYDLRVVRKSEPTMAAVSTEEARGKNLFILHAPNQASVNMMRASRRRAGLGAPAFVWNLFPADGPADITRVGCCTLEMRHAEGLSRGPFVMYYRGLDRPMQVGESVRTIAFTAEVRTVNTDGVPTGVRFSFPESLESRRNLFVQWNGQDFEPVVVPSAR